MEDKVTRVRYKNVDGTLVSKEMMGSAFVITAEIYQDLSWSLKRMHEEKVLCTGKSDNLAAAKRAVKQELKEFGVQFLDEVRNIEPKKIEVVEHDENVEEVKPESHWG